MAEYMSGGVIYPWGDPLLRLGAAGGPGSDLVFPAIRSRRAPRLAVATWRSRKCGKRTTVAAKVSSQPPVASLRARAHCTADADLATPTSTSFGSKVTWKSPRTTNFPVRRLSCTPPNPSLVAGVLHAYLPARPQLPTPASASRRGAFIDHLRTYCARSPRKAIIITTHHTTTYTKGHACAPI